MTAHPGIGIVNDNQDFIYYTDLSNVWKLNMKTMKATIAVAGVHTHEICMNNAGYLFRKHL